MHGFIHQIIHGYISACAHTRFYVAELMNMTSVFVFRAPQQDSELNVLHKDVWFVCLVEGAGLCPRKYFHGVKKQQNSD